MKLSDFKFTLNDNQVAQYPAEERDKAKMMVLNREKQTIDECVFREITGYLKKGDVLVVNETKVFPARLEGIKEKTDAKVEIFLLRQLENDLWEVLVKPARKVRIGNRLVVTKNMTCDVIDNTVSGGRVVRFSYTGDFFKTIDRKSVV